MTLQEKIYDDMKKALKERETGKRKLSTIRLARAALKNREIALGKKLTDEDVIEVIAKEVKQCKEAILEYQKANKPDKVRDLEAEIAVLNEYLPQQLQEEEIEKMAREVIAATGAQDPRDSGKVMSVLMPKVKGKADGKLVHEIVKNLLLGNL